MKTISDLLKNAIFVKENLQKEVDNITQKNSQKIIDYNIENQLYDKGVDSFGRRLKEYSNLTKKIKRSKGQPFNRTTLFDTGSFTKLFQINKNKQIFSTDPKSSDLQDKYGTAIFGLTEENNKKVNYEIFKPKIQEFVNRNL